MIMPSRLVLLIKAFGLADGVKFYVHFLFKKYGAFKSAKYKSRFRLRKNFADKYTFTQVFLDDQYNIDFPFQPLTIIDGGANIGLAAAYFAYRYPEASIVAIEPSKNNFKMVQENTAAFKQIKAYCKGIWSKSAYLHIINATDHDNAFIVEETAQNHKDAIPAVSIEDIMRQHNWKYIHILKLDIEGSEKEVFESGFEYWLPRTRAIIIEIHDHMRSGASKAVFQAITKYNFSFSLQHENLIFINQGL